MWIVTFLQLYMVTVSQRRAQMQISIGTLQNLKKVLEIKVRGRICGGTEETEIQILNRIVRITPNRARYEADPRHRELLVRSMGLETETSVVTPGVKPAEPEICVVKGKDMQCLGPVMDSTGKMREALTDHNGNAQLRHNDALDKSLLVDLSLCGIANDATLDDKHICALQRSAVERVTFNDGIDYGTNMA